MYNLKIKYYADVVDLRIYSSNIKTNEDRLKPRKRRVKTETQLVYVYNNPFTGEEIVELLEPPVDENERLMRSQYQSFRRTRHVLYDLCMSNIWDYFVTFTFNQDNVDRYDFDECSDKMSKWINNQRNRYALDLKYIVVPEQHKDGAWHFHGLFANCGSMPFVDSGHIDKKGRVVYNLETYRFGFTTATSISDNRACSMYIQKYMTKDLSALLYNKKRYWASRNLNKPRVETTMLRMEMEDLEEKLCEYEYKKNLIKCEFYDISQYTIYTTNFQDLSQTP